MSQDITYCVNQFCPLWMDCERHWPFVNTPSGTQASLAKFEPGKDGKCDMQIPKRKKDK